MFTSLLAMFDFHVTQKLNSVMNKKKKNILIITICKNWIKIKIILGTRTMRHFVYTII